nr:prohibitin family protein [Gloeothece verrucosa]
MLLFVILALVASFFVVINAGERGVLMRFGKVQNKILGEGIHLIIPIINTVERLSIRIQKHDIYTEIASKDLQQLLSDISLNWHIVPERANIIYQRIGNLDQVIERIIEPAAEEIIKGIMAKYTVQEIITRREDLKKEITDLLITRLNNYDLHIDEISLTNFYFSTNFQAAVEAKQIAEQEAKKAGFLAQKAAQEAQAKINLAKGEAEAQRLLKETLSVELLQKQAIEKWNGNLPLVITEKGANLLNLEQFTKMP